MRSLSQVSAPLLPTRTDTRRSFARRQRRAVYDSLTYVMVVRHGETPTELYVSKDGNVLSAVWIHKSPILIDPKNRGRFLVLTMTRTMEQKYGFSHGIIDREKFLPEERANLEDAIQTAKRARERMQYGGRKPPLHPNATA
jgi:hypothetical protein